MTDDDFPCCAGGSHEATTERELLIAEASLWSGWCTDNDLALLGSFLLNVKHQMALDRDHPSPAHHPASEPLSARSGTDTRSDTLGPQMSAGGGAT